jgi:Cu2+-exporting ATPase
MTTPVTCSLCLLPIGRLGQQREVNGEALAFCCYGCCLAYQVHHGEREEPEAARLLIRLGVGAFLAMNIMLFSLLLYSGVFTAAVDGSGDATTLHLIHWLLWILTTPLLVMLGGPFIAGSWRAARMGRLSTDTLVTIGVLAAYGFSAYQVWHGSGDVYFDTVTMVLILFTLGRYLEALGRVQAARSLAPMLAAERAEVRVVADGIDILRPVHEIGPDTVVRILPGERIAVDAVVIEGRSECDEAVLTGQADPQLKTAGAPVHAGSINGAGHLLVRATAAGTATRWIQISRMVREALARKSLLGNTVDRLAAVFIPMVLLLAAGTLWFWSGVAPFEQALLTALAVLVVACPCSLGLAAPLATTLGIGLAAQRGILLRSGGVLEKLARIKAVAFDKTGTLTEGRPQVLRVSAHDTSEEQVLIHAASLARASEHPLAKAITRAQHTEGTRVASEVQARPGAGISGRVDGRAAAMGSAGFMSALGWQVPALWPASPQGCTLVYVGWEGRVQGLIALADRPLPEAAAVTKALRDRDMTVLLLSGDREPAVAQTATRLGIPVWRSELMPEDKVGVLRDWTQRHGPTAMVGDGLNDGPVLAAAVVGIAVGGATDLARESADIVLPEHALANLPWLFELAAQVRSSIRVNLGWALGYNLVALGLAASGLLQPVLAAGLMAGSSLVVVIRSLGARRGLALPSADRAAVTGTASV